MNMKNRSSDKEEKDRVAEARRTESKINAPANPAWYAREQPPRLRARGRGNREKPVHNNDGNVCTGMTKHATPADGDLSPRLDTVPGSPLLLDCDF
jgi:hypothetical protein